MIEYTLKNHRRAKRITISVRHDGSVLVTKPRWVPKRDAESFVAKSAAWITKARLGIERASNTSRIEPSSAAYKRYKSRVLDLITKRVEHFNARYRFAYGKLSIRNQSSRWGSCSSSGTLSFNYQLLFLPDTLADYIIVHELCHLKEMNHSKRFWALVAQTIPDHAARRRELRKFGRALLIH